MKFSAILKKGSERAMFSFFGFIFYSISIMFIVLSTAIPLYSHAFILTVTIGSIFLVGGVLVSLLWGINEKLNKFLNE